MRDKIGVVLVVALATTAGWQASSLAGPTPALFKVSKVKVRGKGKALKVRYTLTASGKSWPAATSGKGGKGAAVTLRLEVTVRCAHCGIWYEGSTTGDLPSIARGKTASLTAGALKWSYGAPPARARTCQVRWYVKRKTAMFGTAVATRCRSKGRIRAGACPGTVPYSKRRCRKVRAAVQARRARARRARLAAQVAKMGQLKILGTRGSGGTLSGSSSGSLADAFGTGGLTIAGSGKRGGKRAASGPFKTTAKLGCLKLVSGKLDLAGATRAVRRALGGFRATYERALRRDPQFTVGKLTVEVAVLATGRTRSCKVSPVVHNAAFEAGIKRYLERLRFPPPEGGAAKISFCLTLSKISKKGDAP